MFCRSWRRSNRVRPETPAVEASLFAQAEKDWSLRIERMAETVHLAWTKWPTGTYMLWYPIKDPATVGRFHADMRGRGIARVLRIEVEVRAPVDRRQLNGCGLLVINPPWTLPADMQVLLPALSERLGVGGGAGWRCDWIAGDRDRA